MGERIARLEKMFQQITELSESEFSVRLESDVQEQGSSLYDPQTFSLKDPQAVSLNDPHASFLSNMQAPSLHDPSPTEKNNREINKKKDEPCIVQRESSDQQRPSTVHPEGQKEEPVKTKKGLLQKVPERPTEGECISYRKEKARLLSGSQNLPSLTEEKKKLSMNERKEDSYSTVPNLTPLPAKHCGYQNSSEKKKYNKSPTALQGYGNWIGGVYN